MLGFVVFAARRRYHAAKFIVALPNLRYYLTVIGQLG